jgi:DNA primase
MREKENEPLQALDPGLLSVFSDIPDSGKAYLAGRGFDLGCIEHFSLRFDTSRRAIVFPVYEPSGNLVGCVGRGIEGRRHHNYFNFPTGRTVGGIQKFSPTRGKLALVEGFTDLLNCYQWARDLGFDVCCTWTANLTRDQAILIADTGKRIHCWFDQDPAGRKGFETVQRLLEDSDYGLTRAVWPDENLDVGAMNRDTFYSIFSR